MREHGRWGPVRRYFNDEEARSYVDDVTDSFECLTVC